MVVVPRWAGGGWSTRLGKKRFEGGSKEVLEYYRSVHRSKICTSKTSTERRSKIRIPEKR